MGFSQACLQHVMRHASRQAHTITPFRLCAESASNRSNSHVCVKGTDVKQTTSCVYIKSCTHVATNVLAIDLRLEGTMACNKMLNIFLVILRYLSQLSSEFQHFSLLFSEFHKLFNDRSYNMMQRLFLVAIASNSSQVNHCRYTITRTGYARCCKSYDCF